MNLFFKAFLKRKQLYVFKDFLTVLSSSEKGEKGTLLEVRAEASLLIADSSTPGLFRKFTK
jgi:hypothetical protein